MDAGKRNTVKLLYVLIQFLYWAGGCVAIGYAAAFMRRVGFSNSAIGTVISISGLVGFGLMMLVSEVIDRKGNKAVYAALAAILVLQIMLLLIVYYSNSPTLPAAACYTIYMALTHTLNSVITKLYINLRHLNISVDFGISRGIGSFAYAVCSILIGYIAAGNSDAFFQFLGLGLFAAVVICSMIINLLSKEAEGTEKIKDDKNDSVKTSGISFTGFIRKYKSFVVLVLGTAIVSAANKTLTAFLINIVSGVGGDLKAFGYLGAYLAVLEVPVTLLYSKIRRKSSVSSLLILSMLCYLIKIGGFTVARSITGLFIAATVHAFSTGLYQTSIVEYVRENIPFEDTAKCQSLMAGFPLVIAFLSTMFFGFLLDVKSISFVLVLLTIMAVAGCMICVISIRKNNKK